MDRKELLFIHDVTSDCELTKVTLVYQMKHN